MTDAPMVQAHQSKRAASLQLRVADAITKFAGSMAFIYIHVVVFGIWCGTGLFGHDKFPFNFLTMSVSLEAIFLATFVMIGQNRQAEFAQAKANHDFVEQEQELKLNTKLTKTVQELATEIHGMVRSLAATAVSNTTNITNVAPPIAKKAPVKRVAPVAKKVPAKKAPASVRPPKTAVRKTGPKSTKV